MLRSQMVELLFLHIRPRVRKELERRGRLMPRRGWGARVHTPGVMGRILCLQWAPQDCLTRVGPGAGPVGKNGTRGEQLQRSEMCLKTTFPKDTLMISSPIFHILALFIDFVLFSPASK